MKTWTQFVENMAVMEPPTRRRTPPPIDPPDVYDDEGEGDSEEWLPNLNKWIDADTQTVSKISDLISYHNRPKKISFYVDPHMSGNNGSESKIGEKSGEIMVLGSWRLDISKIDEIRAQITDILDKSPLWHQIVQKDAVLVLGDPQGNREFYKLILTRKFVHSHPLMDLVSYIKQNDSKKLINPKIASFIQRKFEKPVSSDHIVATFFGQGSHAYILEDKENENDFAVTVYALFRYIVI